MPKNHQQIPKSEREAAIVEHARALFLTKGYRGTSMSAVASAAGLATGAVNWYFPSKDDLFAAVVTSYFDEERARIESDPEIGGDPGRELVSALTTLVPYRALHREAYERMDGSEAVRTAYAQVQEWVDNRLIAAIADRVPAGADIESVAEVAHVLIEGILISGRRRDRPTGDLVEMIIGLLSAAVMGNAIAAKAN
ncbi:AcrR family transcriptional regulator [Rhodococcus sp. LBL1]|nr:AcrR family transcriptional regulator [Rhodococcus sp. LBL1]MDH6685140.1 AcrR family transcriptional regulator [Rhodococcus sp. LBL2]